MKVWYLITFGLFIACISSSVRSNKEQTAAEVSLSANLSEREVEIYKLVNDHRFSKNIQGLILDRQLNEMAREHSLDMSKRSSLDHNGIDARMDFLITESNARAVAENVAQGHSESRIVDMWLQSKGHRENIENPVYTTTGIGLIESNSSYYVTQIFMSK